MHAFDLRQQHAVSMPSNTYRYDPVASELMCDEIGVAYPVIAGIPRLLPSAGRVLPKPDAQDTAGPSTGPTVEPWSQ